MPLDCGISSGFDIDCTDLKKPGGVFRKVWVFNLGDLRLPIDVTLATYLTDLEFNTYQSLYAFESVKFSHDATWVQQNGDGGNVSYLITVNLRLANNNPTTDKVIEDASVAELVVITKSNAGEFQIWGAGNGLSAGPATTGGTGRQSTDSTFTQLTLVGVESYLPKRLLRGTAAATQSYLEAMEA